MIRQHYTGRATAYNHQQPFERAASFAKESIYICDKNITELQSELKMWAEPDIIALLGTDECEHQRQSAQSAMQEQEDAKTKWTTLYVKLGACPTCAGSGWLWECMSQDESVKVKCDACGGAGKSFSAQAVIAATLAKTLSEKAAAAKQLAEVNGTVKGDFITSIVRKFK